MDIEYDLPLHYNELLHLHHQFRDLQYQHWLQYEFLTYQWWMLLGVLIVPWFIWWKFVDKSKAATNLCYGLIIMFSVIAMDAFGINAQHWIYPIKLVPFIPHTIPLDWSLLPVIHMLIYQYFPRWRTFLIVEIIDSAFLAFVGEPFTQRLGIYYAINWPHIWSFPIYTLKAVIAKGIVDYLVACQKKFLA